MPIDSVTSKDQKVLWYQVKFEYLLKKSENTIYILPYILFGNEFDIRFHIKCTQTFAILTDSVPYKDQK